jgi:hypothetical protein
MFNYYACRIRSLVIYHFHLDEIDDRVLKALISASPSLLPNLHSLKWWDDQDSFIPLLHALLGSTIRSVMLSALMDKPWKPSFAKSTLLVSLGARCPHIQDFFCPYGTGSDEHSGAVCEAVCCWMELFYLKTGTLNTRALTHLASLPSLR